MHASPATLPAAESERVSHDHPGFGTHVRNAVLVVDDNEFVAGLVACILERRGQRVLRARDAREALRIFSEYEPEIVLAVVDCRLPDGDGVSLAHRLRETTATLPVLLTSGENYGGARALHGGASAFLPKPFLPAQLRASVEALLRSLA